MHGFKPPLTSPLHFLLGGGRERFGMLTCTISIPPVAFEKVFVSVNTPTKEYGVGKGCAADVKYIELCARQIAEVSESNKIIIEKSTVPSGTAATLKAVLSANSKPGVEYVVLRHGATRHMPSPPSFFSPPNSKSPAWSMLTHCRPPPFPSHSCHILSLPTPEKGTRSCPTQSSWQRGRPSRTCSTLTGCSLAATRRLKAARPLRRSHQCTNFGCQRRRF